MTAEARLFAVLTELKLQLPYATEPKGVYRPLSIADNFVFVSGHLPVKPDGTIVTGRLGADLDVAAGFAAAQLAGLGILASLRKQMDTLDYIVRLVKVFGVVNCTPDFTEQPAVINGCSELFAEVFGPEIGIGSRSAIGACSLPLGAAVEIEAVFEIE